MKRIMAVAGLLGFVVASLVMLLLLGQLWPSMQYEDALPIILVIGGLVAMATALAVRRWRRGSASR